MGRNNNDSNNHNNINSKIMKYPKLVGWSVVITMWAIMGVSLKQMKNSEVNKTAIQETISTAEDMIEWIIEDEASGNVGRDQADTYIDNLEGIIIIDLGVTR